jgi:hypothetical protein
MSGNYLKLGDYNAICDVCGFKFKASELKKRWDNVMVCPVDYEPRHPQLYIHVSPDSSNVPWVRPEPADLFIDPVQCSLEGNQATADIGVADCMRADFTSPY